MQFVHRVDNQRDEEGIGAMTAPVRTDGSYRLLRAALAMACLIVTAPQAIAEPLILQGSTTFNRRIMEPFEAAIEAKSGQDITVIPNRTMLGIIALMEGRAHMAMISASLESEINKMKKAMPGLDYDRLKAFEIASTRVAFIVNSANPVRKASLDQIKNVLTGQVGNWSALGGKDGPIRLVIVGGGGGVVTTIESELLNGQAVHAPNIIYVKTPLQLTGIVEQEQNAMGMAQLSLARQKGLPEVVTERPVEQTLSLITLGDPTPAMKSVIDAARVAAGMAM
jgi:phosphate transport system substrate-binding protein